jgi:pimeloyl-ACP methyl ester carboxylesterase
MWLHHVEAVGAALRYSALEGDRPTVVMVTGMGLAAVETFLPTLADSALRRRRLLFVDPFACGYSDAPVAFDYSLREQAEAVASLLRERADAPYVLVGFSAGGSIAAVLADEHPELVARLVIVEAALAQGGGSISPWIAAHDEARFVEQGHGALLERFDGSGRTGPGPAALHAFFARTPPFALYRMARALVEPLGRDVGRRLLELHIPRTYVAGGAAGTELTDRDQDMLEEAGAGVLRVPHAAHLLPWENPRGLARALAHAVHAGEESGSPTDAD